ncbi:E3 ubiquitin-protein ligase HRD1 [Diplonema papillatum]|nr:E3 ubiquitin-protein ligase HRD1 [Diplonema papillatum]
MVTLKVLLACWLLCLVLLACLVAVCAVSNDVYQVYPAFVLASRLDILSPGMTLQLLLTGGIVGKVLGCLSFSRLSYSDIECILANSLFHFTEALLTVIISSICVTVYRVTYSDLLVLNLSVWWKAIHFAATIRTEALQHQNPKLSDFAGPLLLLIADGFLFKFTLLHSTQTPTWIIVRHDLVTVIVTSVCLLTRRISFAVQSRGPWGNGHILKSAISLTYAASQLVVHVSFIVYCAVAVRILLISSVRSIHLEFQRVLREIMSLRHYSNVARGIDKWVLDASPQDLEDKDTLCCICYQDMLPATEKCKKLYPCGHVYHRKCIIMWFNRSRTCPYCRGRIKPPPAKTGKKLSRSFVCQPETGALEPRGQVASAPSSPEVSVARSAGLRGSPGKPNLSVRRHGPMGPRASNAAAAAFPSAFPVASSSSSSSSPLTLADLPAPVSPSLSPVYAGFHLTMAHAHQNLYADLVAARPRVSPQ